MYGQGMYGGPMYGPVYYPGAGASDQARGWPQEREPAPVKFTEGKLFIGGVDAHHITKDDLVQYCSQWGEVADAVVMDKKNYGFVTFADPKNAMKFLETRVHELKNRRLDAKAAVPKAHLGTAKLTKKMFVGGTGDLTDDALREHFAQFGEIEDAAVVRREGQSRGFGFITFADEISVEKCLLVNHYIKGRKVELKRAVPKEDLGGTSAAAAAAAGVAAPAVMGTAGFPQHPQQLYAYPYGPPPFAMRPPPGAAPFAVPGAAGAMMAGPVPHDPYAHWYAMGYMPYYHPAAGYGGYYGPMVPPQAGMPYPGVPFVPTGPGAIAMRPGVAQLPAAAGAVIQEEAPFLQAPGIRQAGAAPGPARGPGRPSSSTEAADPGSTGAPAPGRAASPGQGAHGSSSSSSDPAGGSSSKQQRLGGQQQQQDPAPAGPEAHAASTSSSPSTSRSESLLQQRPQLRSSSAGQLAGASGLAGPGQGQGVPLLVPAGSSPFPQAGGRRPVLTAYPMFPPVGVMPGLHSPQPLLPPRGMMQLQATLQQQQQQQLVPAMVPPGYGGPQPQGQQGQGAPGNGSKS